ncbi:MAG: F0F1 ATP synthase subunit epsilon [Patescibacteria group bacterium]
MSSDDTEAKAEDQKESEEDEIKQAPVTNVKAEKEQKKALEQLSSAKDNANLSMQVLIHSPFREYYDGPAFSVTAKNATGPFDILPQHHNFISLISACDIIVRTVSQGEQRFTISGGILHVKADKVVVFLDV